jgi:hypothetical protein
MYRLYRMYRVCAEQQPGELCATPLCPLRLCHTRWSVASHPPIAHLHARAPHAPQDTGEGIIITTHDKLPKYLGMLTHAVPIESQFTAGLVDHLNAEIVLGTVSWLGRGRGTKPKCGDCAGDCSLVGDEGDLGA